MAKLSILIPSRNEPYLYQTIRDCFAKATGDIEVVVHLDGYWPSDWKTITDAYPNLRTVHSGEAVGMRPGINKAAGSAISRGAKYLFKLDAHCQLDEGFDEKLLAEIESNWIVIPRRKRLDPETWTLQDVGKPDIDYHYLSFPDDPKDFGGPGLNGKVWTQRIIERRDKPEYNIDDEMSSQGSAWLCSADYFQQLDLMDTEAFGPFWCEAQEVLMKAWLSGGRCVVNKKTWYAHWHKGKSGRGYRLEESWLKQGRNRAMLWPWNEVWDKQTVPFKWLIEHFWPVPSWPDNWEEVLYATRKPRVVGVGGMDTTILDGDRDSGGSGNTGLKPHLHTWPPAEGLSDKAVLLGRDALSKAGLLSTPRLRIHKAHYGIGSLEDIDVREHLQNLAFLNKDSLDIIVNNSTLTPGQNPFRGKKKRLLVRYSFDGGEVADIARDEKDWLIIGPVRQRDEATGHLTADKVKAGLRQGILESELVVTDEGLKEVAVYADIPIIDPPPRTPAALNDYLIRRFSISSQRLRGPMPIELRDFHRNDLAQLFAELGFKRGAEIGVAEGNYSEVLLKANPECELLLVDPWHHYSDNPQNKTKEKHQFAYREVVRKTKGYKNVQTIADYSMRAVQNIEVESLDFVYIDGHHSYPFVMCDIIEWTKRVRSGGIVALDDIYKLDEARWGAGPMEAIYDYTRAMRINPWWLIAAHKSVDAFFVKP